MSGRTGSWGAGSTGEGGKASIVRGMAVFTVGDVVVVLPVLLVSYDEA